MFAQREYQKDVGVLSYMHLILKVGYAKSNSEQTNFVEDLIHATIPEILRSEDAQKIIDDGVFQHIDSYFDMQKDVTKFLPHICNERNKNCTGPNDYRCRKWNNRILTKIQITR